MKNEKNQGEVVRIELDSRTLEYLARLLAARERETVYVYRDHQHRCSLCGERIRGSHACSGYGTSAHTGGEVIAFGESRSHTVGQSVSVLKPGFSQRHVTQFESDC